MQFALMRHGEAELTAPSDFLRELTDNGKIQVLAEAKSISRPIKKIITSPYIRAQQTAKIMAETLGIDDIEVCDKITPNDSVAQAIKTLEPMMVSSTLIVCHMPIIAYLTSVLVYGHMDNLQAYRVNQIRWFETDFFADGLCEIL